MSHKRVRETTLSKNLSVASKCLAIVLVSKVRRKNSQDNLCSNHEWDDTVVDTTDGNVIVQSSEVQKALSPNGYNGKELLQDFKIRNKTCYWNPSLVESIKSLEYKGFVEPSTILVSGGDIHIENIRSAWGRRVLKAPAGFVIERIGDVNGIQMQEIPQTQFMPLPDALCSVIMELNVQRVVATLDVILDKLSAWYRDMTLPDHQVIVDILGALIKDRKVFHTGSGYFVVTPDTNRLPNGPSSSNNNSSYLPTNASWLPYHPMYVPVFQGQVGPPALTPGPPLPSSRSHMRSISCQVTTIEETESEGEDEREKIAKLGGGGGGGGSKSSTLTRSSRPQSIRYSNKPGKDPKPGVDKDKDSNKNNGGSAGGGKGGKGNAGDDAKPVPVVKTKEKTSLLSKIFGRSKKKANSNNNNNNNIAQQPPSDSALMPPPALPPPPPCQPIPIPTPTTTGKSQTTATDNSGSIAGGKSQEPQEKEYATFSAQFPPAEWAWYQQQLDKQKRTENWVTHQTTSSKASTVLPTNNRQAASSTLSRRPPQGSHDYHGRKSLMPLNNHQVDYLSMNDVNVYNPAQKKNPIPLGSLQYDGEFLKPDNLYESFRNSNNHPSAKQRHRNSHHRKSRDLEFIGEENTQPSSAHLKHHHHQHPSQHHNTQAQSHHHKKMSDYDVIDQGDITPVNGSNVYHSVSGLSPVSLLSEDSIAYAKLSERHQHVNPGPLHSTPRYSANRPSHGYGERTAFKLEGHEGRDRIYGGGPSDFTHGKRRSHRSKRRNHRAYSFYSGNGDDISIEYNGRLPNKNSSRVQSRDSGVNCMGLGKNNKNGGKNEQGAELYENTPVGKKQTHHNKQASKPTAGDSNHVHFDVNNLTCADSMSMDPFASTSSMAYQPEVTNPAFNSVVYGSSPCTTTGNFADNESTLGPMGSSVMYQTITTSALEPSELRAPQTSPQRGYYEDGSCNVSVINRKKDPGGEVVTIQAEITQGDSEEYIDVEGGTMPDIREVAGSSNGMLEIAADDDDDDDDCVEKPPGLCSGREGGVGVSMGGGGDDDCDSNQDVDVEGCGDEDNNDKGKGVGGDIEKDICVLDINDREGDGKPSQCVDSKKVSKEVADPKEGNQITSMVPTVKHGNNIPPVDGGVADSGFSSPRNQGSAPASSSSSSSSDPRGQVSGQSLSDHSSGHPPSTEISDRNHHNSEDATTEGSDGLHTHSEDINMATSSEHHSGSTNDNGDLHSEDSSSACGVQRSQHHQSYHYNHHPQQQPQQQIIKYRQSSSHASGGSSCSSTHSYPYNLHGPNTNHSTLPPPSTNAKVITHPDVFNNNHNNNFVNASAASSSSNTVSYSDQEQRHFMVAPPPPQLHYHPSHPHRGPMVRSSSNPTNVQGWSSSSSSIGPQQSASRLQHRFEEEQLSKKYGGEFEVMGVL